MQNKILSKEALQRLEAIHRLSQEYNRKLKKEHRNRLVELMKEHAEEIDELFRQDNPHYLTETGDLIILCMELLLENNQPIDKMMEKCFQRYEKKLPKLIFEVEHRQMKTEEKMSKALYRGSRKHILDWTERKEEFVQGVNELLKPSGAFVSTSDFWMPRGYESPTEARLGNVDSEYLGDNVKVSLADWWLVHKKNANTPNWDLLMTCTLEGRKGLVLFEAKANVSELKDEGKTLNTDASAHSIENHARIGKAIEEARVALAKTITGVNISRDSHYQLSNRIAYAYKLAFMGIPVVLVYLGFLNDHGIIDAGEPFHSDKHWRKALEDHMEKVLPVSFTERRINCNGTPMQMLIRSRKIYQVSSPQSTR